MLTVAEIKNALPGCEHYRSYDANGIETYSDASTCSIHMIYNEMDIYIDGNTTFPVADSCHIDETITIETNVDFTGPCDWRHGDDIGAPRIRYETTGNIKNSIIAFEKFLRDEVEWIQECRDVLRGFTACQVEFVVRDGNKDVVFGDFTLSNWKHGDEKIIEVLKREIKDFWD